MRYLICICSLFIFYSSCCKNKNESIIVEKQKCYDTINKPSIFFLENHCLAKVKGFKKKYGIVFSNYYCDEPLSIDFDNNSIIDTIAILKPFYQNDVDSTCYPENLEIDSPFLVISKTIDSNSVFLKVYKNLLSNNRANFYEELNIINNGFIISNEYNGNNGFFSKTYISFKESNFYVDSINVESWGQYQYQKTIKFKNKKFNLSKYKRIYIDSIRSNFNKLSHK